MLRSLKVTCHKWSLTGSFRSAYGPLDSVDSVRVEIGEGKATGRGECRPFLPYGQDTDRVLREIETVRENIKQGMSIQDLQAALPAGSARNALDCALWDLRAKITGQPVWQLAGLPMPQPLPPTLTIPALEPVEAGEIAASLCARYASPLVKVKMPGDQDVERIAEIHRRAPHARIIIDPNCSWTEQIYRQSVPVLARHGVVLIEQPFHPSEDARLERVPRLVPLCADESCSTASSLDGLKHRYECISIKLDKSGGLTEALHILQRAQAMGFDVMVSSMISASLALAPALILAAGVDYPSLALPVMVQDDPVPQLAEDAAGQFGPPPSSLWG